MMPKPSQILATLWERFPALWPHTVQTLYTTLVGFGFGILIGVLLSMYQQIGGRIPYHRGLRAAMDFVDSLTAPVLTFFRRWVPMLGPLDLSPLVVILLVQGGGQLLAGLIAG